MKLSKWMTISMASLALAGGVLTADADSMVLSGGEKLDLGEKVSVFDGKRSFSAASSMTGSWRTKR